MKSIKLLITTILLLSFTSLFSQNYSVLNGWLSTFKGDSDMIDQRQQKRVKFRLDVHRHGNEFKVYEGYSSSFGWHCNIRLPEDYSQVRNLTITETSFMFESSRKYPYEILLKRQIDRYGDVQITGIIKIFEVLSNGELLLKRRYDSFFLY